MQTHTGIISWSSLISPVSSVSDAVQTLLSTFGVVRNDFF